jgi:hypothetical protein
VPLSTTVQELRERIVSEEKFVVVKDELRFVYAGKPWVDGEYSNFWGWRRGQEEIDG